MNKKKRSTPPNPAAAAREAAQRKARDERQQNQGSPEHRHLPEGVPYRDPVSPLEERFNPMRQALPEPPSLRLPPIYGPPPRQQPGPSHHQLPQSLPPPPRHEALLHLYHKGCHPSHPSLQGNHFPNQILLGNHMEYPISSFLLHRLVDIRVISIGELFNGWGLFLKIQWCLSLLTHKMHLSFQSTWIEKSILILILMTCTIQTLSRVTSMTLLHHQMKVYSPLIHIPLPLSPSNPFILHPLQDWMLPELPRFLLGLTWNIMDLFDLIYQCLLC